MTSIQRWERATDWPLMVAAVAFLAAYAIPILEPSGERDLLAACRMVVWVTWALFAIDYLIRLRLAADRRRFIIRN